MDAQRRHFYLTVIILACGGIPKGYDEGGFSASVTLSGFKEDYDLLASEWKNNPGGLAIRNANITSFGVLGAAFGSILALLVTDRLGRLWSWRGSILLWASGILMQVFASGIYGFLLFARIWGGLGAGALTVVSPLYLSEVAPARSRGLIVSIYMVFLLTFLSLGFFVNYGVAQTLAPSREQYRIVQALPLVPVGLAWICSFFVLDESPRWLAAQDCEEQAVAKLCRLRGADTSAPEVRLEVAEIQAQLAERRQTLRGVALTTIIKEIFSVPSYRRRFLLAILMQTVAQWSGGNGITYYITQIFGYAGVTGSNTTLITGGAYGLVKLVFTMAFTWGMVDIIGRRKCFLWGLSLQLLGHAYLFFYMLLLYSSSNKAASDIAILCIFIYAAGWSIGLCTVQYLYSTEIFPTRLRSVCYAVNMTLHWAFQFAVVYLVGPMFVSMSLWGPFLFWGLMCLIGLVLLGLMAPETKRVPMEQMDELFQGPWYAGWKAKASSSESVNRILKGTDEKDTS